MKILLIWLIVLSTLGGGGYYASKKWPGKVHFWKTGENENARKFSRPTTAVVSPRNISFAITAAGEITPAELVNVRPEIGGRIEELPVDTGE
jgi:multidrug efflux pump subunit AcrA (membrane-fusion protein)